MPELPKSKPQAKVPLVILVNSRLFCYQNVVDFYLNILQIFQHFQYLRKRVGREQVAFGARVRDVSRIRDLAVQENSMSFRTCDIIVNTQDQNWSLAI